jgi:hypothetical protein
MTDGWEGGGGWGIGSWRGRERRQPRAGDTAVNISATLSYSAQSYFVLVLQRSSHHHSFPCSPNLRRVTCEFRCLRPKSSPSRAKPSARQRTDPTHPQIQKAPPLRPPSSPALPHQSARALLQRMTPQRPTHVTFLHCFTHSWRVRCIAFASKYKAFSGSHGGGQAALVFFGSPAYQRLIMSPGCLV